MAYAIISNASTNVLEVSADVVEHDLSGSSREITLTIYIHRTDFTGGTSINYSISGGMSGSGVAQSYASPVEIASQEMTVDVDDNGYAYIDTITVQGNFTRNAMYEYEQTYFSITSTISGLQLTNGGDSGGDSSTTSYTLTINQGDGTELTVIRTWDEIKQASTNEVVSPTDGLTVTNVQIVPKDHFTIESNAKEGYKLDYYDFNGTQLGFKLENLTRSWDEEWQVYRYKTITDANASITSTATPIQYGLTLSSGEGAILTVTRISSKYKDAKIGKLSDGDPIWHHDVLEIACDTEAGYNVSVNIDGESISGNGTYTVAGDVVISTSSQVKSYLLVLNEDMGSEIKVNRTSSPLQGADTGLLGNDAVIYYNDVLTITFIANPGYEITNQLVNQEFFISGDSHTVTGDVEVVAITGLFGNVHIFDGETFSRYIAFIYDSNGWAQYIPWVFDGSGWKICS